MISRSHQSRFRFLFVSLAFLVVFVLSGCGDSSSTSQDDNQQPTAKITASLVSTAGKTVTLDGSSSSDPDGDALNFRWEQIEGPDVTLSGVSTATLSFVAPTVSQSTQFTFELTVDDGDLSSTASVSFQLSPSGTNPDQPNQQPYAMITAPETATSGQTVTLNGSGSSDPDGDNLSYQWTQTEGASITFSNSTSSTLTFVAPTVSQSTKFTFQLTVADGALSSSASVSIQVTPRTTTNQQPSAKITAPQTATSGQTVTLNGSGSSDPDGGTLSYQWKQTQGPDIVLSNSSSSSLTFVAPAVTQVTQFTFQLTVNDGELSNSASVSMQISPMGGNTSPTCATAEENNSLTLSCPSGEVITEVVFASYGTPVGSCGSFTTGSCNASNSVTAVSDACKGKNSCTLYAGSDTFGNPCEGTAKKLAAEVACGMETDSTPNKTLPKHWHETGGYGTDIEAGLGGKVYKVTNLNMSGAGSLGEAISASGERLVVFEVGGVIDLEGGGYTVKNGHITIAGETAPSPGITLVRGSFVVDADDVVVSHITVQYGTDPGEEGDAANNYGDGVVFNHVSIYWAVDENLSMSPAHNTTIYKCIIAEGLSCGNHEDGEHSKGSLIYKNTDNLSLIGTLYVHNALRNPRVGETEIVISNGVVYNWAPGWDHVGPVPKKPCVPTDDWFNYVVSMGNSTMSFEGNVGIQGPESVSEYFVSGHRTATGEAWMNDNIIIDPEGKPLKIYGKGIKPLDSRPFWPKGLVSMPAHEALYEVLRTAGSRPADRDIHNARVIGNVANGDGMIIDSQDEVGGYADYAPTSRTLTVPDGVEARRAWLDEMEDAIAVDRNVDLSRLYDLVGSAASDKLK